MNRSFLKFLAALLVTLMVGVYFAGLDNLPRDVRNQIAAERQAFAAAQAEVRAASDEVTSDFRSEPELFRNLPAAQQWTAQLSAANSNIQSAAGAINTLEVLAKQNRRGDRQRVLDLIARERPLRAAAVTSAAAIRKDAAHWVELKRNLPQTLQQMDRDYRAVQDFDLAPTVALVRKAETDWPDKQGDLEARLEKLRQESARAAELYQSSAPSRRAAAAGDVNQVDFPALLTAAETLKATAASLPSQASGLQPLTSQLYTSWDKILVDMETRRGHEFDQKIRTIRTRYNDATAKAGEVTSDEKWVTVSQPVFETQKSNLGMAIEHKPAGKYDVEAERVAQPAGFAYVAPPSQGRNQYGYWERRDGRDFWVFYAQYALLRDLLFNNRYQPLDRYDWEGYYSSRRSGQTYYGRDGTSTQSLPKYGSQGTATQERYSGSTFAKGGGFRDSKYATGSGSYSSSKYATPGGDRTPKRYGSGSSRPEEPRAAPPPTRSYRPAPSPSPRPSYRSPSTGRRYGKR